MIAKQIPQSETSGRAMHTLGDMAGQLNRPVIHLHSLQIHFELPVFKGKAYSDAYLAFLRMLVLLRTLGVPEQTLRDLWKLEKKLLVMLHVDSTGSPTWFLDACSHTGRTRCRLLLTNRDMGATLPSHAVQLGLDFSPRRPELFAARDMGEDALAVFNQCLHIYSQIQSTIRAETPILRAALHCARTRAAK